MSFSIRPGNNGDFFRRMNQLPANIDRAINTAVTRAGLEVQEKAVPWAPVKTGNLRRSITVYSPRIMRGRAVIIGTNLVYAKMHDVQTYIRPHTRTSAFGRRTRPYQVKGRLSRPYKGRGFLTPAWLIQKRGRFRQIMEEEINAVLRKT